MFFGNVGSLLKKGFRAQMMSVSFKGYRTVAVRAKEICPGTAISLHNTRMGMPEDVRSSRADNGKTAADGPDEIAAAGMIGSVMRHNQDIAS